MRLIHFAHIKEAEATLEKFECEKVSDDLFLFEGGKIVVSGIGAINASVAIAKHAAGCSEVWNFGAVGALRDFEIGEMGKVSTVSRWPGGSNLHVSEEGWHLVTSVEPVHEVALKEKLCVHHDVVDMEGYAVVRVAKALGLPVQMTKVVTDFASEGGRALIEKHLRAASEQLALSLAQTLSAT